MEIAVLGANGGANFLATSPVVGRSRFCALLQISTKQMMCHNVLSPDRFDLNERQDTAMHVDLRPDHPKCRVLGTQNKTPQNLKAPNKPPPQKKTKPKKPGGHKGG